MEEVFLCFFCMNCIRQINFLRCFSVFSTVFVALVGCISTLRTLCLGLRGYGLGIRWIWSMGSCCICEVKVFRLESQKLSFEECFYCKNLRCSHMNVFLLYSV